MAQLAAPVRQALAGARAPMRLPPQVQAKLDVGPAGDHFEREADQVAASVMAGSAAPATIPPTITPIGAQRAPAPTRKEEKKKPGAKAAPAQRKAAAPSPKKKEEKKPPAAKSQRAQRKAAAPSPKKEEKKPPAAKGKPAQRKAAAGAPPKKEEKKPPKAKTAQRESYAGAEGGTAPEAVDNAIQAMRAGPAPGLDGSTRGFMEGRFGRDFGGVRVHHGPDAAKAADAIGARAFTTGNDIFFNRGQYQPGSSSGRQLIAHELTHTVQQQGGGKAARVLAQRAPPKAPPPAAVTSNSPAKTPVPADGVLDFVLDKKDVKTAGKLKSAAGQDEIILPYLNLPMLNNTLKGTVSDKMRPVAASGDPPAVGKSYSIKAIGPRPSTTAVEVWKAGAEKAWGASLASELKKMAGTPDDATEKAPPKKKAYQLSNGCNVLGFANPQTDTQRMTFIFGTPDQLAKAALLYVPRWTSTVTEAGFQADHILEWQLGGADSFENMWLLEGGYNGRIGPAIDGQIKSDIAVALQSIRDTYDLKGVSLPEVAAVRSGWRLTFSDLRKGPSMGTTSIFWTPQQIKDREHLKPLKFLTSKEMKDRGFTPRSKDEGIPSKIYVFPTPAGGRMHALTVNKDKTIEIPKGNYFFHNMALKGGTFDDSGGSKIATLKVLWKKTKRDAQGKAEKKGGQIVREDVEKSVDLEALPGFLDVGFVSVQSVYAARTGWDIPTASPVTFDQFGLDLEGYLVGGGTLTATKALLPGLRASLVMDPEEIRIDFPIPMDSFSLGPVTVTTLAMSLGMGDSGVFVRGAADFVVASLGQGSIMAEVSKEGPVIAGKFNLATDFLDPAFVDVSYAFATDEFKAQATLGVQKGKIPGLESGQVTVGFSRDAVNVAGTLDLGGPLKGTTVTVAYAKETGLKIGADNIPLPLSSIPAVQNATLSISATQKPEGGWSFAGTGKATLAVPGATGTITISYLDGAITFNTDAVIEKGPATGHLNFTATNRAIDEEGKPVEGPPTDEVNVWGKGSVTIRFGNILTGTAGVELTPDNRVIIQGEIGLPPVFEVFPKQEYSKDLFTLKPPEFPIWGVSVAGVGVGIFAFVDARVYFDAYVGPGEIRDAKIGAVMDLDKPEDATVTGHAEFHVPAYAGLGLDVGGGLRARVAVAYAEGRVGLKGELGIQADAGAQIDIAWSKATGLDLKAEVSAQAQPKFNLSAVASVTVGVDLLLTDISHTFGPWIKQLGSFGPDMTLGVKVPVHWSEAAGLDLSLDKIEVTKPSLDASALMSSVFDQLAA